MFWNETRRFRVRWTWKRLFIFLISSTIILIHYLGSKLNNSGCFGVFNYDAGLCHGLLSCLDFNQMEIIGFLGEGAVKSVNLAKWKHNYVVVSQLKNNAFNEDFAHNLEMLQKLRNPNHVAEYLGHCNHSYLFTKYYPYGSLINLDYVLDRFDRKTATCLRIAMSYVKTIDYLHNSPAGVRVMCDANDLGKLLSQFLIKEDLNVVVNDLDALPEVEKGSLGIVCGHRRILGDFVAPEQLWPHFDRPFKAEEMIAYNHKIDVWKIPDVSNWIVSLCSLSQIVTQRLEPIHVKCKSFTPSNRPTAMEVFQFYDEVLQEFINH